MVFVEALFCGLPILYTQGWSVDGLFKAQEVGYAWNGQPDDVARGLRHLIANEQPLKASIAALHARGGLDPYKRDGVVATYRTVIDGVLGT
jgi:hypothetical protein